ncbi:MAG: hypothetical protein QOD67_2435 [Caballeronia sp.]|jgi:hypothetical protein|nr:hypothetical protein [Caballeronia sp.]
MMQNVAERVGKRRAALRAAGLRPSLLLREDSHETEILDFIEASMDTKGWE